MKKADAEVRLNATLAVLDTIVLHTTASELGTAKQREKDAAKVRRLVEAATGKPAQQRQPTQQRFEIVRDFVRRHPEHQSHFAAVFGDKLPSAARIDDAWTTLLRLQEQTRRRHKK